MKRSLPHSAAPNSRPLLRSRTSPAIGVCVCVCARARAPARPLAAPAAANGSRAERPRQWPEVNDLCHFLLHAARAQKHTAMRESHAFPRNVHCRAKTCDKIRHLGPLPRAPRRSAGGGPSHPSCPGNRAAAPAAALSFRAHPKIPAPVFSPG